MDEKTFKRHLKDLVHGKHNTAEHDWSADTAVRSAKPARRPVKKRAKPASRAGARTKRAAGR
jgi:hypothetical protein